ncbi:hypothetical protein WMY93_003738 [Mugilogobius chulae]|uniref:Uncharacterized protein n=1 Tax=Mugilogobius chulae TaxID=88201 RepID=A0AAW0Q0R5_9GOBI
MSSLVKELHSVDDGADEEETSLRNGDRDCEVSLVRDTCRVSCEGPRTPAPVYCGPLSPKAAQIHVPNYDNHDKVIEIKTKPTVNLSEHVPRSVSGLSVGLFAETLERFNVFCAAWGPDFYTGLVCEPDYREEVVKDAALTWPQRCSCFYCAHRRQTVSQCGSAFTRLRLVRKPRRII